MWAGRRWHNSLNNIMRVVVVKVKQGNSQEMVFRREGVWWRMVGRMAAHWAPHGFGQLGAVGRVARPWWPGGSVTAREATTWLFRVTPWPARSCGQRQWPGRGCGREQEVIARLPKSFSLCIHRIVGWSGSEVFLIQVTSLWFYRWHSYPIWPSGKISQLNQVVNLTTEIVRLNHVVAKLVFFTPVWLFMWCEACLKDNHWSKLKRQTNKTWNVKEASMVRRSDMVVSGWCFWFGIQQFLAPFCSQWLWYSVQLWKSFLCLFVGADCVSAFGDSGAWYTWGWSMIVEVANWPTDIFDMFLFLHPPD